ncbi:MAG: hypothetical protein QT04_C0050G0030 [archaeon GW2011_AR11]|nr:MAG: hypothetical protein QT04_C0050G0030 [archaeon GW2011_AR11]
MKEQTLLKIALVSSILGLAILFAVARSGDAGQADISSIDGTMKGNQVKILGTVQDVHNTGEVQILDISGDHRGPDTRHPLPAMIAELFLALLLGVLAGIITG